MITKEKKNKTNQSLAKRIVALLLVAAVIVSTSVFVNRDMLFGRKASKSFFDTKSWMMNISDDTELGDINIPGTHDSAAINKHFKDIYARHYANITEQLNSGIRLLDVRIQLAKNDDGSFRFLTCHGNIGSSLSLNTYQSFESLLVECDDFLRANPTETIIMSLKVDDDRLDSEEEDEKAFEELKNIIYKYSVRPYQAELGTLGEARGQIILFNRLNSDNDLGYPISWNNNPLETVKSGDSATENNRQFDIYVQDHYDFGCKAFTANKTKADDFLNAAQIVSDNDYDVLFNFASGVVFFAAPIYPYENILNNLIEKDKSQRPKRLGWVLMDYEDKVYMTDHFGNVSLVNYIIESNKTPNVPTV